MAKLIQNCNAVRVKVIYKIYTHKYLLNKTIRNLFKVLI